MRLKITYSAAIIMLLLILVTACRRDRLENPYDSVDYSVQNDNPQADDIPTDNFAYLHAKIFRPTCANAGCHDGSFEPEFRSVSSSYNTLVNHPVISNDELNSFEYRVVPGSVANSLLHTRLTESIPNTTGMMPPEVDPGSDWPQNKESYINLIENWIENGAKDMYGNDAPDTEANFPATVEGLAAFPAGNTSDPYQRDDSEAGITPILVEPTAVDIWIFATDDSTPQQQIEAEIELAQGLDEFSGTPEATFSTTSTISALDFFDNTATFHHRAEIDLSNYASGETIFLRCYVSDADQESPQEIPGEGSSQQITSIFVLKIQ